MAKKAKNEENNEETKKIIKIGDNVKADANKALLKVGDNIKVYVRLKEGNKERIQMFNGTIIVRRGKGDHGSFTVRRIAHGVGVERIFPVICPSIAKIELENSANVRRAKLYYMRRAIGKKAMLKGEQQQKGQE